MASALEDKFAIIDRFYAYVYALDETIDAQWLDCFTDDGTLRYKRSVDSDELVIDVQGKERLTEWISNHKPSGRRRGIPGPLHHLVTNPRVTRLDGDRAEAVTYFVRVVRSSAGLLENCMTGRLHGRLRRCDDAAWRFEEFMVVDAID